MKSIQTLIAIIVMLALAQGASARLYSWIDDQGIVQFSDRIPPNESDAGRTVFSDKGVKLQEIPPAKTKEELEQDALREAELERLRKEQQQLAEAQREADQRLLRSFPTEDDIILARDRKLATVDHSIQLNYTSLKRMKQRLLDLKTEAEQKKRNKKTVSSYEAAIESIQQQIEDAYAKVLLDEQKKEEIRNEYQQHARRYRELKHLALTPELSARHARDLEELLETVAGCERGQDCEMRWQRALAYARKSAMTPIALEGQSIFMTAPASTAEEISITASLIPQAQKERFWIFLDLQCLSSDPGEATCQGPVANAIRAGFKQAVSGDGPG